MKTSKINLSSVCGSVVPSYSNSILSRGKLEQYRIVYFLPYVKIQTDLRIIYPLIYSHFTGCLPAPPTPDNIPGLWGVIHPPRALVTLHVTDEYVLHGIGSSLQEKQSTRLL